MLLVLLVLLLLLPFSLAGLAWLSTRRNSGARVGVDRLI